MNIEDRAAFIAAERERLRVLRVHFGLSESQMAIRLGMSRRAYVAWERGPRSTRGWAVFMIRLAEEFNVSIDWLGSGKTAPWKPDSERDDLTPLRPGGSVLPDRLNKLAAL